MTPNDTSSLAYFPETVQGTSPGSAANWVTNGIRVRHVMESIDVSSFKQAVAEDMRSQENVLDDEPVILGIKGGIEWGHECYATGLGTVAADGATVVQNQLSEQLEHCMGGVFLSNTTTATGGTTTTAVLTADTAIAVGCYLCVVLLDQPQIYYPRRVVAYNAGTNTVTFDKVLPRAVAAADVILGCATHYFDEDFLNDSSIGPTTWSWLISLGRGSEREHWEARGSKSHIDSISLPRGAAPKIAFKTKSASYRSPEELTDPAYTVAPDGSAPIVVGPRTSFEFSDYGSTTSSTRHVVDFSVKPGGVPVPCETDTEEQVGMPGVSHYGLGRDQSVATFKALFAQGAFTNFNASTLKVIRWARHGGPGAGFAVAMHRANITATPVNAKIGPSMGMEISAKGLPDTAVGTTDLARSRLVIVLW